MNRKNRREFIRQSVLKAIGMLVGIDLLASHGPHKQTSNENFNLKNGEVDWEIVRKQFGFRKDKAYFNFGSLGLSPNMVINEVERSYRFLENNGYSGHGFIEMLRKRLALFLNVSSEEIGFTRNTTEGINIAAYGLDLNKGDEVITTLDEHIGGTACWLKLEKEIGISIKLVKLDQTGKGNLEIIKNAITKRTKVLCVSHITSTTGMVLPISELVKHCRKIGITTVIDGAQGFGMVPINLRKLDPDIYCSSGHKWICGPKGIGFIFKNSKLNKKIKPVFIGAYSDSKFDLENKTIILKRTISNIEYGTRNISLVQGFSKALDFVEQIGIDAIRERCSKMSEYFINKICEHPDILILSPSKVRFRSSLITFRIMNKDNLAISLYLRSEKGIATRGIHEKNLNAIRVSFSLQNSYEEIDRLVTLILAEADK